MKLSNRGFTMIELLASVAIGIIVSYSTYYYISYIAGMTSQLKLSRVANDNVQAIVESIRFNLSMYQVTFETNVKKEDALLTADKLPYGISNGNLIPREQCAKDGCQAYFGYVIVPSLFVRNLYQVDIKIALASQNILANKWKEEQWKKYTYFITVK